jgi:hypothetical protein
MFFKRRELFGICLLFLFIFTILSIDFLHTEHGIHSSKSCPACHFQNSTATTLIICFFFFPQLTALETLMSSDSFFYHQPHLIIPLSRSPPLA